MVSYKLHPESRCSWLTQMVSDKQEENLRNGRIWLGGLDNDRENDRNRELRTEGTCGWVLDHECFKSWLGDSNIQILWIYGIPGISIIFYSNNNTYPMLTRDILKVWENL